MKKLIWTILIVIGLGTLFGPPVLFAQGQTPPIPEQEKGLLSNLPSGSACYDRGDCTLEDIMQVFVNFSELLLYIVGSLTLAAIVWGGFLWMTSAGSSDRVAKGKKVMGGAVVGLLIVLGAFTVIEFGCSALGANCLLTEPTSETGNSAETTVTTPSTINCDNLTDLQYCSQIDSGNNTCAPGTDHPVSCP